MDRDYIINVILTGQNLLSGKMKEATRDIQMELNKVRVASENAFRGVPKSVQDEYGRFTAETVRLGGAMGKLRDIQRSLTSEMRHSGQAVADGTNQYRRHGGILGTVAEAYRGLFKQMDSVYDQHGRLLRVTNEYGKEITGTEKKVRMFRDRLEDTGRSLPNFFRGARQAMKDMEHGVRDLTREERIEKFGRLGNAGYNIARGFNRATLAVTRFNPALGILAATLLLVVTVVTDFVGALTALGSAAVIAAAGIGGVLVAAVAQLIPVVGIAIATMTRLKDVFAAVQAQDKAQTATSKSATDVARQRREALQRLADAQYALKQANISEADAMRELTRAQREMNVARREAIRAIQDAKNAQIAAIFDVRDAELSVLEGQRGLSDAIGSGDLLTAQRAMLNADESRFRLKMSQQDLTRSTAELNRLQQLGVQNSPQVVAATDRLRDANRALAAAQHDVAIAARNVSDATKDLDRDFGGVAASVTALQQAMAKLDPAEKRLVGIIERVKKAWKDATRPISDSIINAIGDALLQSEKLANNPRLQKAFGGLGKVIADQIREISKFFTSPQQVGFMEFFTGEAAKNAPRITRILESLIVLFEKVGKAASPLFERILIRLDKFLNSKAEGTSVDKLTKFFDSTEKYIMGIVRLFGAFFNLLGSIISAAAGPGLEGIKGITDQFNEWAEWIDKHPQKLEKFFKDAIGNSGLWLSVIGELIEGIYTLGNSPGFRKIVEYLEENLVPIFQLAADILTVIVGAFMLVGEAFDTLGLGFITDGFLKLFLAIFILSKTIPGFGALIRLVGGLFLEFVLPALVAVTKYILFQMIPALYRMAAAWLVAIGPAGWIALAIIALIALITWLGKWDEVIGIVMDTLNEWFGFFKSIFTLVGDLIHGRWSKLWDDFKEVVVGFVKTVVKVWLTLPRILGQVFVGIMEKLGVWDDIKRIIGNALDWIEKKWKTAWSSMKTTFGNIWDSVVDKLRDVVNTIIDGINWVLNKIGIDELGKWEKNKKPAKEKMPPGAQGPKMAEGGIVHAVPGGRYMVAEAGHPEAVVPLDPSKRGRAFRVIGEALRMMGVGAPGMAEGGIVVPSIPVGQITGDGKMKDWLTRTVRLGMWLQQEGFRVGEHPYFGGLLGRHSDNSYHYSRQGALDINRDGSDEMGWLDALNARLRSVAGGLGIAERLWRVPDHFDHLHVALGPRGWSNSGGIGFGDIMDGLRSHLRLPKITEPGKKILTGIGKYLIDKAWDWVKDKVGDAGSGIGGFFSGIGGRVGGLFKGDSKMPHSKGYHAAPNLARGYAVQMLRQFGWNTGEYPTLNALWNGESGWRWNALNQSSGAYGIPQSLPASKMASAGSDWLHNAFTQILWGLNYIKERYGSPSKAYSEWLGRDPHWYAAGGRVRGRMEGEPVRATVHVGEWVLNRMQQSKLAGMIGTGIGNLGKWLFSGPKGSIGRGFMFGGDVGEGDITESAGGDGSGLLGMDLGQLMGILNEMNRFTTRLIRKLTNVLTVIEGFFNKLAEQIDEHAQDMARDLRKKVWGFRNGVASRLIPESEEKRMELENKKTTYGELTGERDSIQAAIASVAGRIPEMQGRPQARQLLVDEKARLEDRLDDVEDQILDNIQDQAGIEEEMRQAKFKPQTFSSAAWRFFRSAIFTGMGGILPQYRVPSMGTGGFITQDGLIFAHAGEAIVPAGGMGNVNVFVTNPTEVADPTYMARRIAWELKGHG